MAAEHRLNIKFVQEVEKNPCLYNYKLPEYTRKDKVEKAWKDIGLNIGLTGPECKEKWKNLRSVFVRHLRQHRIGSTNKTHLRPYYLSDHMQFAIPFVKIPNFKNSAETSHEKSVKEEIISSPPSRSESESEYIQPNKKALKHVNHEEPTAEQYVLEHLKMKQATTIDNCDSSEETSNKMFLLSLLSDMNKMRDMQRRVFKQRILKLVDEILMEEENTHVG